MLLSYKKAFPLLKHDHQSNTITGRIRFVSRYVPQKSGTWKIVPSESDEPDCFSGDYSIRVDLETLKVYETEGKLIEVAIDRNRSLMDMHIQRDNSCCLDYYSTMFELKDLPIRLFMLHKVYPFFCWQAFYETYNKKPPCGDCPHDTTPEDFIKMIKNTPPDADCICGKPKKFKHCHGPKVKSLNIPTSALKQHNTG